MIAAGRGVRGAWKRLIASPAAMFAAVLTVGLGTASMAQQLGLYHAKSAAARRCSVVLACPRTNAAHAANARANGGITAQNSAAYAAESPADSPAAANSGSGAAGQAAWLDKNSGRKPGEGGLTVPLPDFSAPELSRFISPL